MIRCESLVKQLQLSANLSAEICAIYNCHSEGRLICHRHVCTDALVQHYEAVHSSKVAGCALLKTA